MKVAAVFATYNRPDIAAACIRALLAGQRAPDHIIVADNASTPKTREVLGRAAAAAPANVEVLAIPTNLGNAGGVALAVKTAFDKYAADAVWILDDDSLPDPSALGYLCAPDAQSGLQCSLVLDNTTGDLAWPVLVIEGGGRERLARTLAELPQTSRFRVSRAWLGAMIPRRVYVKAGPIDEGMFLRGEDEDYPRRMAALGETFIASRDSILRHPPVGQVKMLCLPGLRLVVEPDLRGDKLYYRVRNGAYIIKRDSGAFKALVWVLLQYAARFGCLHIRDGQRDFWSGVRDGWQGVLGRRRCRD